MAELLFVCIVTGFLLVVLGLAGARHDLSGSNGAVEALEIVGFVCFLFCFVLTSLIQFGLSDSEFKQELTYALIACSFLAGRLFGMTDSMFPCLFFIVAV